MTIMQSKSLFVSLNSKSVKIFPAINFKYWENYKMYLDLMKKFVDKNISGTEFSYQLFQMWKSDRDKTYNSEELVYITESFKLTEINGFSSLISDLFLDC